MICPPRRRISVVQPRARPPHQPCRQHPILLLPRSSARQRPVRVMPTCRMLMASSRRGHRSVRACLRAAPGGVKPGKIGSAPLSRVSTNVVTDEISAVLLHHGPALDFCSDTSRDASMQSGPAGGARVGWRTRRRRNPQAATADWCARMPWQCNAATGATPALNRMGAVSGRDYFMERGNLQR